MDWWELARPDFLDRRRDLESWRRWIRRRKREPREEDLEPILPPPSPAAEPLQVQSGSRLTETVPSIGASSPISTRTVGTRAQPDPNRPSPPPAYLDSLMRWARRREERARPPQVTVPRREEVEPPIAELWRKVAESPAAELARQRVARREAEPYWADIARKAARYPTDPADEDPYLFRADVRGEPPEVRGIREQVTAEARQAPAYYEPWLWRREEQERLVEGYQDMLRRGLWDQEQRYEVRPGAVMRNIMRIPGVGPWLQRAGRGLLNIGDYVNVPFDYAKSERIPGIGASPGELGRAALDALTQPDLRRNPFVRFGEGLKRQIEQQGRERTPLNVEEMTPEQRALLAVNQAAFLFQAYRPALGWTARTSLSDMVANYRDSLARLQEAAPTESYLDRMARINVASGADAVRKTRQELLDRDATMQTYMDAAQRLTQIAADPQQPQEIREQAAKDAARYGLRVKELAMLRPVDIVERNMNPWAEIGFSLILDPLEWFGWATSILGLSTTARRMRRGIAAVPDPQTAARLLEQAAQGTEAGRMAERFGGLKNFVRRVNPFALTPETAAQLDTAALYQVHAQLLSGVTTKEDARRLLQTLVQEPQELVRGVEGLTSPNLARQADFTGRVRFGGFMATPDALRARRVYRQIGERILDLPSLKGEGPLDRIALLAELDDAIYDAALRLHGVRSDNLPQGFQRAEMAPRDDGQYEIRHYGPGGTVVQTEGPFDPERARDRLREIEQELKRERPNFAQRLAGFQRALMSELYLNMRPAHWARNAFSAAGHLTTDGIMTFEPTSDLWRYIAGKTGGIRPNRRLAEGVGGIEEMIVKEKRLQEGGRSMFRRVPIVGDFLGAISEGGQRIWTGETAIKLGKLDVPIGEQNFYLRAFTVPFRRTFERQWRRTVTQELGPLLDSVGVEPSVRGAILNAIVDAGRRGDRAEVLRTAEEVARGQRIPFSPERFGVPPDVLTPDGWEELRRIVQDPGVSLDQKLAQIDDLFQRDAERYMRVLDESPPQPGRRIFTDQEELDDLAASIQQARAAAKRAGLDPDQAEQQVRELFRRQAEIHEQGIQQMQGLLENVPPGPGMRIVTDAWSDLFELKREIRLRNAELVEEALEAADQSRAWGRYFQEANRNWEEYNRRAEEIFAGTRDKLLRLAQGEPVDLDDRWDWVRRFLEYEEREVARRRRLEPRSPRTDQETFQEVIQANREYVDREVARAWAAARRTLDKDALDILLSAERDTQIIGAQAAGRTAAYREQMLAQQIPLSDYYRLRNETWRDAAEAQAARWRAAQYELVERNIGREIAQEVTFTQYEGWPDLERTLRVAGPIDQAPNGETRWLTITEQGEDVILPEREIPQEVRQRWFEAQRRLDQRLDEEVRKLDALVPVPGQGPVSVVPQAEPGLDLPPFQRTPSGPRELPPPPERIPGTPRRGPGPSPDFPIVPRETVLPSPAARRVSDLSPVARDAMDIQILRGDSIAQIARDLGVSTDIVRQRRQALVGLGLADVQGGAFQATEEGRRRLQDLQQRMNDLPILDADWRPLPDDVARRTLERPTPDMPILEGEWRPADPRQLPAPELPQQAGPSEEIRILNPGFSIYTAQHDLRSTDTVTFDAFRPNVRRISIPLMRTDAKRPSIVTDGLDYIRLDVLPQKAVQKILSWGQRGAFVNSNEIIRSFNTLVQDELYPVRPYRVIRSAKGKGDNILVVAGRGPDGNPFMASFNADRVKYLQQVTRSDEMFLKPENDARLILSREGEPIAVIAPYHVSIAPDPDDVRSFVQSIEDSGPVSLSPFVPSNLEEVAESVVRNLDVEGLPQAAYSDPRQAPVRANAYSVSLADRRDTPVVEIRRAGLILDQKRTLPGMPKKRQRYRPSLWRVDIRQGDEVVTVATMRSKKKAKRLAEGILRHATTVDGDRVVVSPERLHAIYGIRYGDYSPPIGPSVRVGIEAETGGIRNRLGLSAQERKQLREQLRNAYREISRGKAKEVEIVIGGQPQTTIRVRGLAQLQQVAKRFTGKGLEELEGVTLFSFPGNIGARVSNRVMKALGMEPDEDLWQFIRRVNAQRRATRMAGSPEVGDMAAYMVFNAERARDQIKRQLPNILQEVPAGLNERQNQAILEWLRRRGLVAFDEAVAQGLEAGRRVADFAMLNYSKRRNVDTWLSLLVPYHYWFTRSALNWVERMAMRPGIVAQFSRLQRLADQERQEEGLPLRYRGTVPVPFTEGRIRIRNPLTYLIPLAELYTRNEFNDPEQANNNWAKIYEAAKSWGFGLLPLYDAALMVADRRKEAIRPFFWPDTIAYYIQQALGVEDPWTPETWIRQKLGLPATDQWDTYRQARELAVMAQRGEVPPDIANWAIDVLWAKQRGEGPLPETPPGLERWLEEARKGAGSSRLFTLISSLLTGMPAYPVDRDEVELRALDRERRSMDFGPDNPWGSNLAERALIESVPGLGPWISRAATIPDNRDYERPGLGQARREFYDKRRQLYEEMYREIDRLYQANPDATYEDVQAIRDRYQQRIQDLEAQYPSVMASPRRPRRPGEDPNRGYAYWEIADERYRELLRYYNYEYPGRPEYPGKDASAEEKRAYFEAKKAWEKEREQAFAEAVQKAGLDEYLGDKSPAQALQEYRDRNKGPNQLAAERRRRERQRERNAYYSRLRQALDGYPWNGTWEEKAEYLRNNPILAEYWKNKYGNAWWERERRGGGGGGRGGGGFTFAPRGVGYRPYVSTQAPRVFARATPNWLFRGPSVEYRAPANAMAWLRAGSALAPGRMSRWLPPRLR